MGQGAVRSASREAGSGIIKKKIKLKGEIDIAKEKKGKGNRITISHIYSYALVVIIVLGVISYFWIKMIYIPETPETPNPGKEVEVAYWQNLYLLVKYNRSVCPDLKVEHTNGWVNKTEILEIETVQNTTHEINFVMLNRYNTNDPSIKPEISWVDQGNCKPQALLLSNSEFIQLLVDEGVQIERDTPSVFRNQSNQSLEL